MTALAGHLYHPGRNTQNDFLLTPCLRLLLVETIHCREPGVDARLWALWTPGSVTKLHTHWTPTLPASQGTFTLSLWPENSYLPSTSAHTERRL